MAQLLGQARIRGKTAPNRSNDDRTKPRTDAPAGGLGRAVAALWPPLASLVALLVLWEGAVRLLGLPDYILPPPTRIAATLVARANILGPEALVTLAEMVGGFVTGSMAGMLAALVMARARWAERALGPLFVIAQALPVFAIAPLLVVWFGFGYGSKLAMAALIIFFPVATSFFEGLRRTDQGLVDLARLNGASRSDLLLLIRVPDALPALAAGLRVAAAVAPLGAIVGEWVGSSAGLGLLMLHANARMQTDLVFAALTILAGFSLALFASVAVATRRLIHWAPDTLYPSLARMPLPKDVERPS
jgi:putative hydroxymethylpyrimidine transport system permease protein